MRKNYSYWSIYIYIYNNLSCVSSCVFVIICSVIKAAREKPDTLMLFYWLLHNYFSFIGIPPAEASAAAATTDL